MDSRREFIKKASLLAGAAGISGFMPASIQRALTIDPKVGSTYLDAEHIVFLMQENRSFDHCYGSLQGVRGFNDPRVISLPNLNKAWLQSNARGEIYAPFRLDIKNTKATWMHSLPHSWTNQVDARNNGKYDKWLESKESGYQEYKAMPLTMGYYNRDDIPFYYSLADAFTVCDQNFCSSLTGTTPNRLYFWSGTIREQQNENSKANVWNEDADYDSLVSWKTYPERLDENNISWKVYQNDLSVSGGFTDEEDSWMANFGDNPLEYFSQYNVKLSKRYLNYLQKQLNQLPAEIKELEQKAGPGSQGSDLKKELERKKSLLEKLKQESTIYTKEKYDSLTSKEKSIHEKAFADNRKDPAFYKLTTLKYADGGTEYKVSVPAGDILHQFREDVTNGKLPTVSWLVAPENFSDHPSSAWYGAWYISEVLDILTKNPETWKKTIFVLTYDENDGYYDHVPPFVAPNPHDASTGKTSASVDASTEFVNARQEQSKKAGDKKYFRESSIGLGYRVPLVIASPWSRGGWVNSQVFDHTSSLQFLENFFEKKMGRKIQESNISSWRRAVCGDLTSVFRPYNGETIKNPEFVQKENFIKSIYQAKFKTEPSAFVNLSPEQVAQVNQHRNSSLLVGSQEKGTRPSCALPYELYVDGNLTPGTNSFEIKFESSKKLFKNKTAGSPFTVYSQGSYSNDIMKSWSYAVAAGEQVSDEWLLTNFEKDLYHLKVYGPNGFYREFKGGAKDPLLNILCGYRKDVVTLDILQAKPNENFQIEITDNSYNGPSQHLVLNSPGARKPKNTIIIETHNNFGWYDFSVKCKGYDEFEKRYAGHVETGNHSKSDPAMGFPLP